MLASPKARLVRGSLVLLALLLLLLSSACGSQRTLTRTDIDARAQEYFQRGMELYQRGELRPALENFRLAKAYDSAGSNPSIAEMIDKTEARLRINSPAVAAAPALGAVPTSSPRASADGPFKTFHSRQYPYSVDIPETWALDPGGAKVANTPADLLAGPRGGSARVALTAVSHLLPPDVDGRGYVETNIKLLRSQGLQPDEVGKRIVDGFDASLLRARVTNEQGKLVSTYVLFASERIGWGLTFSAGADESDGLQPLFQRMLDSFHIDRQNTI